MICCLTGILITMVMLIAGAIANALGVSRSYRSGGEDIISTPAQAPDHILLHNELLQAPALTRDKALKLDYPLMRYEVDAHMLRRVFSMLKNPQYELINHEFIVPHVKLNVNECKYKGKPTILSIHDVHGPTWILSDYFNEHCRIKCKLYKDDTTHLEYWQQNREEIVERTLDTDDQTTISKLSNEIFNNVRGCTTFPPIVVVIFARIFGARSMLDISAGWGDRIIGAMAAGIRYFGVDPNPCLHEGYRSAVEVYGAGNHQKYTTIHSPFETAKLPMIDGKPELFDMVLTSPPYFDAEVYSDDAGQSLNNFNNTRSWFDNFLIVALKKAFARLRVGGHMVININNVPGRDDYILLMLEEMSRVPSARYLGVIGKSSESARDKWIRSGTKRPLTAQPFWIWERTE